MGRLGLAILEAAERWWNELDGNGGREGELCWLNRWKMKPQNGVEIRKQVVGCSRQCSWARAHGAVMVADKRKPTAAASQ
jgi:hypothetical protein